MGWQPTYYRVEEGGRHGEACFRLKVMWLSERPWRQNQVTASRNKRLREYPAAAAAPDRPCTQWDPAARHSTRSHRLALTWTRGRGPTTHLHPLLQFQWEQQGPRHKVMTGLRGAQTQHAAWCLTCLAPLQFEAFLSNRNLLDPLRLFGLHLGLARGRIAIRCAFKMHWLLHWNCSSI